MSLKTRRILLILFILSFLIITPLIISYAAGYKFVLGKKALQKTGALILDTEPEGAKIYLNNEPKLKFFKKYFDEKESFVLTPVKIGGLVPREYEVRMEKDGYWGWEKKLKVDGGLSAYAEDVILFKKSLPFPLANGAAKGISTSPDDKYLTALAGKKIIFVNLENEEMAESELNSEASEFSSLVWSPDSKKVIADGIIYETNNLAEELDLKNYINATANSAKWGKSGSDKIFYISSAGTALNVFDLNEKKSSLILTADNISNFTIKDSDVYFINNINKTAKLIIAEIASGQIKTEIELPVISDYEFINIENKYINLYDKKRQTLYLIDLFSRFPLAQTINNIKSARWINENKLLYFNDFEIWLADFNSDGFIKKTLLTRLSETINSSAWHLKGNYIFYSTENAIYALELDDREKRNTTELIKLNKISSLFLSQDAKTLYFQAKIGNQEGIYKLAIQ